MIANVSISASAVRTAFGGSDAAPIAERTSERTTTIRTNDVVITSDERREREERQPREHVERERAVPGARGDREDAVHQRPASRSGPAARSAPKTRTRRTP